MALQLSITQTIFNDSQQQSRQRLTASQYLEGKKRINVDSLSLANLVTVLIKVTNYLKTVTDLITIRQQITNKTYLQRHPS
jgi:hypothetical protein